MTIVQFFIEFIKLCWYTSPFVMMDGDEAIDKIEGGEST